MSTIITKTRLQSIPFFVVLLTNRRFYTSLCYWNAPRTAGITHNNDYQVHDVKKKEKLPAQKIFLTSSLPYWKQFDSGCKIRKLSFRVEPPCSSFSCSAFHCARLIFFELLRCNLNALRSERYLCGLIRKLKQSSHLRNVQGWQFPQLERSW